MERLAFTLGSEEAVVALYRRLVGDDLNDGEQIARLVAWEGIAAALMAARDAAEACGLGAAGLDALDLALIAIARAAAYGQRVAFDAGLEAGAALAGLHAPSVN
ncbi:MAG TPA: hypothetical protein VFQ80_10390 [Thermomicrobiales bacterium]|jgi:hypothetical protein|nr:hypothetical protein [Thermomicrobiales bacterium]